MNGKPTVAYLVSHPIQYQVPLFRKLATSTRIDFVVFFGCNFGVQPSFDPGFQQKVHFEIDLLGGYRHHVLSLESAHPPIDRFWGLRLSSLLKLWQLEKIDVLILHGWRTFMMWQAALAARLCGTPYLIRADSAFCTSAPAKPLVKKLLFDPYVRMLLAGAAGVLAVGQANARFYRQMSVHNDRIFHAPYFVDNDAVAAEAKRGRDARHEILAQFKIPADAFVVIAVGKLMARKRPLDLVNLLPDLPSHVHLLWVGSGEMETSVRKQAALLGVAQRCHLAGFRPAQETWRLLGASDLFALPAENEPWGLVVNEAVAAGLPTIVSDQCGAGDDLVRPAQTGDILPCGNRAAWLAAIQEWSAGSARQSENRHRIQREVSDNHSIHTAATGFEDAVTAILSRASNSAHSR